MNLDYPRRFAVNQNLFAPPNEKHRLPLCHWWLRGTSLRADRKFTFSGLQVGSDEGGKKSASRTSTWFPRSLFIGDLFGRR